MCVSRALEEPIGCYSQVQVGGPRGCLPYRPTQYTPYATDVSIPRVCWQAADFDESVNVPEDMVEWMASITTRSMLTKELREQREKKRKVG